MRVLFATWNTPSHFFPLVPLGWAALAAGHEVRVAAPPSCTAAINQAGLTPVVVGTDVRPGPVPASGVDLTVLNRQRRWPQEWAGNLDQLTDAHWALIEGLAEKNFAVARAMVEDLVAYGRWWRPDVVVYDAVCYAGAVAAAVLGVPAVAQGWGGPAPLRNELRRFGREPLPGYADLFAPYDVAPLLDPDRWVDQCPPSLQLAADVRRATVRYVPYNGPGSDPAWLRAARERPRVCVTWGVTTARSGGPRTPGLFSRTVAALDAHGLEVIVTAPGGAAAIGEDLPPGTRVLESFPLHVLLPACDAVVHHGGTGTGLTAMWAGVPQMLISLRPPQMLNGDRMAAVGLGLHVNHGDLEHDPDAGDLVAKHVAALVQDDRYRTAARRVRAEIRSLPSPADLVAELASIAGRAPAGAGGHPR